MRLHRFFIKDDIPGSGIFILQNEGIAHQLSRVLKIKKGERIVFFNGTGFDFEGTVEKILSRFVSVRIHEKIKNKKDPVLNVHLYQSILKKDKFEWILEKCTELGIKFFHPIVSERSVKTNFSKDRLHRIVQEAVEQSGQDRTPEILDVIPFKDAIVETRDHGKTLLFDLTGMHFDPEMKVGYERVNCIIGPEGGFTANEVELARAAGVEIISLGFSTLRAETAAVVAAGSILLT